MLIGLLTTLLLGLIPIDGDQALERAILIEESEQDLATAARLYESLARDESVSAEIRTRAWLRLGLCLDRQGRKDEARAALTRAAEGEGAAALQARTVLQGETPEGSRTRARVRHFLAGLEGNPEQVEQAQSELIWIGTDAVPHVIEAIEEEQVDLEFVSRACRVLRELGGDGVVAFVQRTSRSKDRLYQRAVLKGLQPLPESLAAELRRWFQNETDDAIRAAVLVVFGRHSTQNEVVDAALTSPENTVVVALKVLGENLGTILDDEAMERLEPLLMRLIDGREPKVRDAALQFIGQKSTVRTPAGRRVYLHSLTRPHSRTPAWPSNVRLGQAASSELLRVATTIGPLNRDAIRPQEHVIQQWIKSSTRDWTREDLGNVCQLIDLGYGYGQDIERWIVRVAQPEDAPLIATRLDRFREPDRLLRWLDECESLPTSVFPVLRPFAREAALSYVPNSRRGDVEWFSNVVLATRHPEAASFLVELAKEVPKIYVHVASALARNPWPELEPALAELVTLKGTDGPQSAYGRHLVLNQLAVMGSRDLVKLAPAAYRLGVSSSDTSRPRPTFLTFLIHGERDRQAALGVEEKRAVMAAVIELSLPSTWFDIDQVAQSILPTPILELFANLVLSCPDPEQRARMVRGLIANHPGSSQAAQLLERVLEENVPTTLASALRAAGRSTGEFVPTTQMLPRLRALLESEDRVQLTNLTTLLSRSPSDEVADWLRPLLEHPDATVRRHAAIRIALRWPDKAVDWLMERVPHERGKTKTLFCTKLGNLLDRRAVPVLLAAMRDPDGGARDAAKAALAQIREYYDHQERWQRWMKAFELGADSAAEALLKQVRESKDPKVRLAAVRSLGTLGVPETLPFLIELMADSDPAVAKAAEDAVNRINEGSTRQ